MKRNDIEEILHPRAIAVVGASSDFTRGASMFLSTLMEIGFEGPLYPINPNVPEAFGIKTFATLQDVPGVVDHVIVGVPARLAPAVVKDAVAKGARSLHFFTSGFAEVDTEEGRVLQSELTEIARGKIRIIGPNCMGIYHPKMKIAFSDGQVAVSGGSGFVSQSGGIATYFVRNAIQEGNYCSKVISIGNSSDLRLTDFFEYFGEDDETDTISMYIEGLAPGEGPGFLDVLKETAKRKPVLLWKGGRSEQGARAAFGHTGAMASDYALWQTVARQLGAILLDSVEEMQDFIKLYRLSSPPRGTRCCLVTFGGGNSVASSDICARAGVALPALRKETQEALLEFIPPMGTIRTNPVDMSASGWEPGILEKTLSLIAEDPNIDAIIFATQLGFIAGSKGRFGIDPKFILDFQAREIIAARRRLGIPVVCNNPVPFEDLSVEELRLHMKKQMEQEGVPTFLTIERAARALRRYHDYRRFVTDGTPMAAA